MSEDIKVLEKHIRVQRGQPAIALRCFLEEVIEAYSNGWNLSNNIKDVPRQMNVADFSVTMVREGEKDSPADVAVKAFEDTLKSVKEDVLINDNTALEKTEDEPTPTERRLEVEYVDLNEFKNFKQLKEWADSVNFPLLTKSKNVMGAKAYIRKELGWDGK